MDILAKTKIYLEKNLKCEMILNEIKASSNFILKVSIKTSYATFYLKDSFQNNSIEDFLNVNKSKLEGFIATRKVASSDQLSSYFSSISLSAFLKKEN